MFMNILHVHTDTKNIRMKPTKKNKEIFMNTKVEIRNFFSLSTRHHII